MVLLFVLEECLWLKFIGVSEDLERYNEDTWDVS